MGRFVEHGDIFTLILDNLSRILSMVIISQRFQRHNPPPGKCSREQLHLF